MNTRTSQARRWRILPSIYFTNYRKTSPNAGNCFKRWFSVTRFWGWKLIYITVKHFQVTLDFRKNWVADMVHR